MNADRLIELIAQFGDEHPEQTARIAAEAIAAVGENNNNSFQTLVPALDSRLSADDKGEFKAVIDDWMAS